MRKLFLGATTVVAVAASAPAFAAATIYYQPVTAPTGAAWIPDGTTAGGHLWLADHLSGLCRLDPGGASATATGLSSCILIGAAGQFAYDPKTVAQRTGSTLAADASRHFVYYTDLSSKSGGVVTRLTFNSPSATFTTARKGISVLANATDNLPDAAAISPLNGDLFVGFKRSADVVRVTTPWATVPGAAQVVAAASGRRVSGLAFDKSNDLYLADANALTTIGDPSASPTGNDCGGAGGVCPAADAGFSIFTPQSVSVDSKDTLYAGDTATVWRVKDPACIAAACGTKTKVANGANVSAVAAREPGALGAGTAGKVFFGQDSSAGAVPLAGQLMVTGYAATVP